MAHHETDLSRSDIALAGDVGGFARAVQTVPTLAGISALLTQRSLPRCFSRVWQLDRLSSSWCRRWHRDRLVVVPLLWRQTPNIFSTISRTMARLIISDEATFHFLSLVEQYPCLWDTGSAEYSNTNMKTSLREHIGKEMMERFSQFGPYSAGERTFFALFTE